MLNSSIENIVEKLNKRFPGVSTVVHKQVFINFLRAILPEVDAGGENNAKTDERSQHMRAVIYLVCKKCGNKYPDDLKECDMCLAMPKLTKPKRKDPERQDTCTVGYACGFNPACDLYEPYLEQEVREARISAYKEALAIIHFMMSRESAENQIKERIAELKRGRGNNVKIDEAGTSET